MRMNFGCGSVRPDGWENVDKEDGHDVRDGLKFDDDTFDYIVANHSLSDLDHHELGPALVELRRILKPGGVLRILVPDLVRAFQAWQAGDVGWFPQGDDLTDVDERFCTYVTWFGTVGSVFTVQYLALLLERAGFEYGTGPFDCGETALCADPEITSLDDRCGQALIVEARK